MLISKKEKGSILLATLLLLAVVTMIAVGMAEREQIDIKRTAQLLTAQQAYLYVKPAEIWAVQRLKALPLDIVQNTPLAAWPQSMAAVTIPGGSINAVLYDAQGEFYNLNNLLNESFQSGFNPLFNSLVSAQDQQNEKFLMAAIISWISPPGRQSDVLSDQYYLTLIPPYRPAHQLFVSPSELRLVKGITPRIYTALFPVMIALPAAEAASTPINVNSATAVVLTGSGQGFSLNDAQAIAAYRQAQGGFRSLNNFLTLPILKNRTISTQNFSIDSNFFLLKTLVSLNNQQLTVYTLFERTKNYGLKTNDIKLLWQLRGTL